MTYASSKISTLAAALVLTACVAKDADTLGNVDDGGSSGSASADGTPPGSDGESGDGVSATSGADGGDQGDDAATTATATATAGDDGPTLMCEPGLVPAEPASCPQGLGLALPEAGCFSECTGEGDPCDQGACRLVEYDPCPCPPDAQECCGACAGEIWLCLDEVVDAFCEQIVGTTFSSVDELECGLTPKGPALCHWQLTFEESGDFVWMHSDVGEGGMYTCVDAMLAITNGSMVDFSFDPDTQTLTWDGVDYRPE